MRSLEDIEQFRAGYDEDGAQSSQGGTAIAGGKGSVVLDGVKTYIRADEESKEVGEYIDIYEDGGTMCFKDPDALKSAQEAFENEDQ